MNESEIRAAAAELWNEAVYATDLDEGRLSASREWETRGDALSEQAAVDRLVARVSAATSAAEVPLLVAALKAVIDVNDSREGAFGDIREACGEEHARLVERLLAVDEEDA